MLNYQRVAFPVSSRQHPPAQGLQAAFERPAAALEAHQHLSTFVFRVFKVAIAVSYSCFGILWIFNDVHHFTGLTSLRIHFTTEDPLHCFGRHLDHKLCPLLAKYGIFLWKKISGVDEKRWKFDETWWKIMEIVRH